RCAVENESLPLLGICLGMQLLAARGEEGGHCSGLGYIPGQVIKLEVTPDERIPHVGWNELRPTKPDSLLQGIAPETDFYFVHSYHFVPDSEENVIAHTPYGGEFVSVVRRNKVWGTQFHPEKSAKPGFQLIRNFLNILTA
ncbi:MAG: imidazole glycerol phosphate synthase subunit HisH, partial [Spirochaetia bacterium]|nr:imidazole glycerol phosphate synthase subunit HisH [Spirochaetia bacterium]